MNASQKRSFLGDCVTIQMSFSKLNAIPMIDLGIEHFKNIFMKKIGVLFGQERSFPLAFIERVNSKNISNIIAEPVKIDKVMQGESSEYAVIIDRISQDVPFYRAYLKNAAICGTAVINNPFWWSADEKFFNNCLATKINVPVPKTVILPSRELPADTSDQSFSNLSFPLDWDSIFKYVGFPAYMKPFAGGGWKNVYRLADQNDFFEKHAETAQLVMLLQEEIVFEVKPEYEPEPVQVEKPEAAKEEVKIQKKKRVKIVVPAREKSTRTRKVPDRLDL